MLGNTKINMSKILNRDVGQYKKGTISGVFSPGEYAIIDTLGWLDEVDSKWKPNDSELMWSITEDLEVRQLWPTCNIGVKNIKVKNAFPTKEKALEARDKIITLLKELK